jgi:hypothetical protein
MPTWNNEQVNTQINVQQPFLLLDSIIFYKRFLLRTEIEKDRISPFAKNNKIIWVRGVKKWNQKCKRNAEYLGYLITQRPPI